MNRSIFNVAIVVLIVLGCAVSASGFANGASYLDDDPNAPTPESVICMTDDDPNAPTPESLVCLMEDPEGGEGAGEGEGDSGDAE